MVVTFTLLVRCIGPEYVCLRCEEVNLIVGFSSPTYALDSIVHQQSGTRVFYVDQAYQVDTLESGLPLNQLDTVSTFIIYPSFSQPDTVEFLHSFDASYDNRCEEYFFDLNWVELKYTSVDNYLWDPAKSRNACGGILEIYY